METSFIWWDLECLHLHTWRSVSWEGVRAWVPRAHWGRPSSPGIGSVQVFQALYQMVSVPGGPSTPQALPSPFAPPDAIHPSQKFKATHPSLRAAPFRLLSNAIVGFFCKIISSLIQWGWDRGGVILPEV